MPDVTMHREALPLFLSHQGSRPLLISMPHAGTHVPPAIASRLSDASRGVPDTDWHIARLYDFASEMGASVVTATHSRYVVDLNRPPDNASLYPGQSTTGLCPLDNFDGSAVYRAGDEPCESEIALRREAYWRPYHQQLGAELRRLKSLHGVAVLWDAHSIRSRVPRFFAGTLSDLNIGTADGASCDPGLADAVTAAARAAPERTAVLNGRFKGGYITRHYGNPAAGIHAIQLELAQCLYMREQPPFAYLPGRAARLQPTLKRMLDAALAFAER